MKGPQWLSQPMIHVQQDLSVELESEIMLKEMKKSFISNVFKFEEPSVFSKFSSWLNLCRVLARCIRFKNNCSKLPAERIKDYLSTEELREVTSMIFRIVQNSEFPEELSCLKSGPDWYSYGNDLKICMFGSSLEETEKTQQKIIAILES
ncbi:hypothetical protein X975_10944, partial [Stegodyphus mimosarum]